MSAAPTLVAAPPVVLSKGGMSFSKTKMCKFNLLGHCSKGRACPFAHSQEEMKALPDLACTKLCKDLLRNGVCTHKGCTYAHGTDELRIVDSGAFRTKPCRFFFEKKRCLLGAKCNFSHGLDSEFSVAAEASPPETPLPPKRTARQGRSGAAPAPTSAVSPAFAARESMPAPPGLIHCPDAAGLPASSTGKGYSELGSPAYILPNFGVLTIDQASGFLRITNSSTSQAWDIPDFALVNKTAAMRPVRSSQSTLCSLGDQLAFA